MQNNEKRGYGGWVHVSMSACLVSMVLHSILYWVIIDVMEFDGISRIEVDDWFF